MGHNATSRVKIIESITDKGLWDKFKKDEARLLKAGLTPDEAFRTAANDLDGGIIHREPGDITPDDFAGKRAPMLQAVEWVFDNVAFSPADIDKKECPSAGAWQLLLWVRAGNEMEFYKSFVPKLLPSRSQLEDHNQHEDDGKKDLALIDRVRRAGQAAKNE